MKFIKGVPLALAATLVLAPAAGATITRTKVTTPSASPTYLLSTGGKHNTFAIKGTTNSTDPTSDQVNIECDYGHNQSTSVESGVALHKNGSFSVPAVPVNVVQDRECRLLAVPTTAGVVHDTGPWLEVSERDPSRVTSGINEGTVYDYYAWGQQTPAADDYDSVGACGFCDSYLFNHARAQTTVVFYANSYLWWQNMDGTGTRSELQIDGRDAYPPGAAAYLFYPAGLDVPGLPKVTYKFHQSHKNGNVTITETDPMVRCNGSDTYPPTVSTCLRFKSTGVELERSMIQTSSGHVVAITDTYKSTDGHAHKLDLLYENDQCLAPTPCAGANNIGYRFPSQHGYAAHAEGDVVHVGRGVGSIYVKVLGAPDGDHSTGQGAITYGSAPTKILFITPSTSDVSDFTMHYAARVTAKKTITYRFDYATAYTYAQVHSEALAAQKALSK